MAAFVFLDKNGIELTVSLQNLETLTRGVAAGEMAKDELSRWMRKQTGGGNR